MLTYVISWEQRKLGECVTFLDTMRKPLKESEREKGIYPYYGASGIVDYVSDYIFDEELVLLSEDGANITDRNYPVCFLASGKYWVNNHAHVLKVNAENENNFICNSLERMDFTQYNSGMAMPKLNKDVCHNIPLFCPIYEEQKQIGDFFRNLDSLITLHQREYFTFDFNSRSAKIAQNTLSWEQRELSDLIEENQKPVPKPDGEYVRLGIRSHAKGTFHEVVAEGEGLDVDTMYVVEANNLIVNITFAWEEAWAITTEKDAEKLVSHRFPQYSFHHGQYPMFYQYRFRNGRMKYNLELASPGGAGRNRVLNKTEFMKIPVIIPTSYEEEKKIGDLFANLDNLITLHQREPPKEDKILNDIKTDTLFHEYYCQWLVIYKEGSVRGVTMQKYHLTAEWVKKLIPDVKLCDFDRITYQQLINDYAETHERQTTMDFHHQLKGAILDAVDDGLIARDPTRKVIIKGKSPNDKKKKYLSRYELQKLLTSLDLNSGLNMDWLILLIAKTGMRFSEAIAVTPVDFDFTHQTLSVNKTWDYKGEGGFQPTKNKSSVRKIRLDWQTVGQFYAIVRELNDTAPIFVSKEKKIYNSTLNDVLERHCKAVGIPTISVHGLRHTHASLLLFDGVSIASVAQRLGHSSINTTQKTYLHIIRELENKDIDLIMKSISSLLD